jgi:hypothetical protein
MWLSQLRVLVAEAGVRKADNLSAICEPGV